MAEPLEEPVDADEPEPAPELAEPVAWTDAGMVTVDDHGFGTLDLASPAGLTMLRVTPIDGDAHLCYERVDVPGSAAVNPGAGLFPLEPEVSSVPLQLFDCTTGLEASRARFADMPRTLRAEQAAEREPTSDTPRLGVRVLTADDAHFEPAIWDAAAEHFAAVGIELVLQREEALPPTGEVTYGRDMQGLLPLHDEVMDRLQYTPDDLRFVPVVVLPSLRFDDPVLGVSSRPRGQATHVPGMLDETTAPSVVLVTSAPTDDPGHTGAIVAHELGHYLGLEHGPGLMDADIATVADPTTLSFSQHERHEMWRHPDLVFGAAE